MSVSAVPCWSRADLFKQRSNISGRRTKAYAFLRSDAANLRVNLAVSLFPTEITVCFIGTFLPGRS